MLDTKTISIFEGILNEELSDRIFLPQCTIQDGFISQGKNWLGDKPRCDYGLVIFQIVYDKDVFPDRFHLGSAVFVSVGQDWSLQHYKIDNTMGI